MKPNSNLAKDSIITAFTGFGSFSESQTREFAFHLTDWVDDLQPFVEFLENPTKYKADEIQKIIIQLLVHAPDHLNEAAEKILNP